MNILVIDAGTTSMKGVLYDEKGRKTAFAQKQNPNAFYADGRVENDPEVFRQNLYAICREVSEKGTGEIQGIAVTAQRSSVMAADRNGKPLMPFIMWQDKRNASIVEEISAQNERLFSLTGSLANTVYSGSKMTWVRRNWPDIYRHTAFFMNIPEYLMFLMTGKRETDTTYGSRTGFMELTKLEWEEELLALYEVEKEKLCRLNPPGSIVGYTTEEFAMSANMPEGIPVITAGGDQQCGAVGQGVISEGDFSIVMGTGGYLVGACGKIPEKRKPDMVCNPSAIAGNYIMETNSMACGAAFDWGMRELYGSGTDYARVFEEIGQRKEPEACVVVPYFTGKGAPNWNPEAKAVFADISLSTTKAELLKSLLESIFMELHGQFVRMKQYVGVNDIYISGGMTKSDFNCQLLSDIFGEQMTRRQDTESTAYGAFLIAAVTLGISGSVREAGRAMWEQEKEQVFYPDGGRHSQYEKKEQRMKWIYQSIYGCRNQEKEKHDEQN